MVSYLNPKDGSVLPGMEHLEVVYAKDQPQYRPLRTLASKDFERRVLSRWQPTPEQRKAVAGGKDIFLQLMTHSQPLQPILMFIADDEDWTEVYETVYRAPAPSEE